MDFYVGFFTSPSLSHNLLGYLSYRAVDPDTATCASLKKNLFNFIVSLFFIFHLAIFGV